MASNAISILIFVVIFKSAILPWLAERAYHEVALLSLAWSTAKV